MPGHAVGSDPKLQHQMIEDALLLEELVKQHDVVFLLLDSREARWLPTVQSNVHSKICLTFALGFDTFFSSNYCNANSPKVLQEPRWQKGTISCKNFKWCSSANCISSLIFSRWSESISLFNSSTIGSSFSWLFTLLLHRN